MKNIQYIFLVLVLFACSFVNAQGPVSPVRVESQSLAQLDQLISGDPEIWGMPADTFMQKYGKLGFRWTSATQKKTARAYGRPMTFMKMKVPECIAEFSDGKLEEITISLYNRGDQGEMPEATFFKGVESVQAKISAWTKDRPVNVNVEMQAGGTEKEARVWSDKTRQWKLEWSYSKGGNKAGFTFRSEYIRLQVHSAESDVNYASSIQSKRTMQGGVSRSELKSKVKTDPNGDVYISGIIMVDQGQKGYCVCATIERVMDLYGRDVDQHELAQVAQTATEGGTSMTKMVDALRKLGLTLGCKIVVHQDWDWKSFQRMIGDYNRVAKKSDVPEINIPRSGGISLSDLYGALRPDTWRETKMKKSSDFRKFKSTVMSYVKQGIPLPWTVCTGIIQETPPVTGRGGHMRMIIGYNTKTSQIIYSDSWGAGHEKKYMSMEDAWTMTDGLYTVEPRRMTY